MALGYIVVERSPGIDPTEPGTLIHSFWNGSQLVPGVDNGSDEKDEAAFFDDPIQARIVFAAVQSDFPELVIDILQVDRVTTLPAGLTVQPK
ncbi:MAG TPA: hypothetical protein DEG17_03360 [Cyanobacteria bacterium UBA11149]|nr:hypothetical protein [Cyanobacteria bacterium UBA11367]HBE61059.1 hypothetical protein [Cyanobacteria bacterium UBA11366]HBK62278.1 hypothetical protein [Cyanobacteria bacterium UBA11166]HBR74244.1 hypothetical protein [Cyanobacteria bacterium UBA11159]HBS69859.1 hypothetical protein [Cyanobacteria bacterium UBA11153]HBW87945.1 hypothetical protein [Cyanobacteria bacterium UBA11149]HCA95023.1 hypothetical protein [Cyanobacteria bacterium UBA9226]